MVLIVAHPVFDHLRKFYGFGRSLRGGCRRGLPFHGAMGHMVVIVFSMSVVVVMVMLIMTMSMVVIVVVMLVGMVVMMVILVIVFMAVVMIVMVVVMVAMIMVMVFMVVIVRMVFATAAHHDSPVQSRVPVDGLVSLC